MAEKDRIREEIDRYPLNFKDWKLFGKNYLDELTPEELEQWEKLHPNAPGMSTDDLSR